MSAKLRRSVDVDIDATTGRFESQEPGGPAIGVDARDTLIEDQSWDLASIVGQLSQSRNVTHNIRHQGRIRRMPSRESIEMVVDGLVAVLFPSHYGRSKLTLDEIDTFVETTLRATLNRLVEQLARCLSITSENQLTDIRARQQARDIASRFSEMLADIRNMLVEDLRAAYKGDPAATSYPEILLGYPGMRAIIYHRLAHTLSELDGALLARLIADIAHSKTGIDIHPGAQIGRGFFIDHGTGVVIGETTIIGDRVRIYQSVTLGARHFPEDENGAAIKGQPRHPIIEDDVVIYAGATILGRITIGRGSIIGGNVWVTRSVPPGSQIAQAKPPTGGV